MKSLTNWIEPWAMATQRGVYDLSQSPSLYLMGRFRLNPSFSNCCTCKNVKVWMSMRGRLGGQRAFLSHLQSKSWQKKYALSLSIKAEHPHHNLSAECLSKQVSQFQYLPQCAALTTMGLPYWWWGRHVGQLHGQEVWELGSYGRGGGGPSWWHIHDYDAETRWETTLKIHAKQSVDIRATPANWKDWSFGCAQNYQSLQFADTTWIFVRTVTSVICGKRHSNVKHFPMEEALRHTRERKSRQVIGGERIQTFLDLNGHWSIEVPFVFEHSRDLGLQQQKEFFFRLKLVNWNGTIQVALRSPMSKVWGNFHWPHLNAIRSHLGCQVRSHFKLERKKKKFTTILVQSLPWISVWRQDFPCRRISEQNMSKVWTDDGSAKIQCRCLCKRM